jgi:hypothetical protein
MTFEESSVIVAKNLGEGIMSISRLSMMLGWTYGKTNRVVSTMIDRELLFDETVLENGISKRMLSKTPFPPKPVLVTDANLDAKFKLQGSIISSLLEITYFDIKDKINPVIAKAAGIDENDLESMPEAVFKNIRAGTIILDVALKRIGFSDGIRDKKLWEIMEGSE